MRTTDAITKAIECAREAQELADDSADSFVERSKAYSQASHAWAHVAEILKR